MPCYTASYLALGMHVIETRPRARLSIDAPKHVKTELEKAY